MSSGHGDTGRSCACSRRRVSCVVAACDILYAGSSALLLLVAGTWHGANGLSLIALVPLLFRLSSVPVVHAVRVGIFFAFFYFFVSLADSLVTAVWPSLLALVIGVAVFALLGGAVAASRRRFGFCPLVVALMWTGAAALLQQFMQGVHPPGLLVSNGTLLERVGVIFGILLIPFIIVTINAVVIVALTAVINLNSPRSVIPLRRKSRYRVSIVRLSSQSAVWQGAIRSPPLPDRSHECWSVADMDGK